MKTHVPVLVEETIEHLQLESGDNVVDCTIGNGGHAEKILKRTAPGGKLLGIDADPSSIDRSKQNLTQFSDRVIFHCGSFRNLSEIVQNHDFSQPEAILLDLGWSTSQLEEGKGFSFQNDSDPLDMRYSETGKTAADLVNNFSERKLAFILRRFADEKFDQQLANKIVSERQKKEITTVKDLKEIVLEVYREELNSDREVPRLGNIHPATKTWQALRIAVNDEIKTLKRALPQALDILSPQGRLAVISFHSLEDRAVKHFFKDQTDRVKIITDTPISASEQEIKDNSSARSAKLRVCEKITN